MKLIYIIDEHVIQGTHKLQDVSRSKQKWKTSKHIGKTQMWSKLTRKQLLRLNILLLK